MAAPAAGMRPGYQEVLPGFQLFLFLNEWLRMPLAIEGCCLGCHLSQLPLC